MLNVFVWKFCVLVVFFWSPVVALDLSGQRWEFTRGPKPFVPPSVNETYHSVAHRAWSWKVSALVFMKLAGLFGKLGTQSELLFEYGSVVYNSASRLLCFYSFLVFSSRTAPALFCPKSSDDRDECYCAMAEKRWLALLLWFAYAERLGSSWRRLAP